MNEITLLLFASSCIGMNKLVTLCKWNICTGITCQLHTPIVIISIVGIGRQWSILIIIILIASTIVIQIRIREWSQCYSTWIDVWSLINIRWCWWTEIIWIPECTLILITTVVLVNIWLIWILVSIVELVWILISSVWSIWLWYSIIWLVWILISTINRLIRLISTWINYIFIS